MPSFDVVSRLDYQEIDNAIGNAIREIANRYDFKGSDTSIERKDIEVIVITSDKGQPFASVTRKTYVPIVKSVKTSVSAPLLHT